MKGVLNIATRKTNPKSPKQIIEKPKYDCMICGRNMSETNFFTSKWSKLWINSDKNVLFCKECLDKILTELTHRYGEKVALSIICAYLDVPFVSTLYQTMINNNASFNLGIYLRQLQLGQYGRNKSFLNSIIDGEFGKTEDEIKETIESRWNKKDKQNMNYVLSTVGYDPFDNCNMSDNDRKYCFNILAGYCDADGIQEDGHKIQSVIQMTLSQLQCRKLDEFINEELQKTNADDARIKQLATTKKQLLDGITKIAQDNNISSAYNSTSKQGVNTLTNKMKEMLQIGFDNIEVNMFDIKTCEAMKQVADLSNRSIMEQLTFDANEYTDMLKEQREMILKYEEDSLVLKEENRNLKNQITDLQTKKK